MKYITGPIIRALGYKDAWWVCGGFALGVGFLMLTTVIEPIRQSEEIKIEEEDSDKKENILSKASKKYKNYVAKETCTGIILKKKKQTCSTIMAEYKRSFTLLFSNVTAVLILVGVFFRLW